MTPDASTAFDCRRRRRRHETMLDFGSFRRPSASQRPRCWQSVFRGLDRREWAVTDAIVSYRASIVCWTNRAVKLEDCRTLPQVTIGFISFLCTIGRYTAAAFGGLPCWTAVEELSLWSGTSCTDSCQKIHSRSGTVRADNRWRRWGVSSEPCDTVPRWLFHEEIARRLPTGTFTRTSKSSGRRITAEEQVHSSTNINN